jgi:hypothetical protein
MEEETKNDIVDNSDDGDKNGQSMKFVEFGRKVIDWTRGGACEVKLTFQVAAYILRII